MKVRTKTTLATVAAAAAVVGTAVAPQAQAAEGNKAAGYAAYISAHMVNVGPIGSATYPSTQTSSSLGDTNHDLVVLGAMETRTGGDEATNTSWATSNIGRAGFDLFNFGGNLPINKPGLFSIVADGVSASCTASPNGATGAGSLGGVNVIVNGAKVRLPINMPANFKIPVPGLLNVTFNKQVKSSDGTLKVTALSIESTDLFEKLVLGNLDVNLAEVSCGPSAHIMTPGMKM